MYFIDPNMPNGNPYGYEMIPPYPYAHDSYAISPYPYAQDPYHSSRAYSSERQQPIRGQATWTEGGPVTKCGIPWSHNQFMTAAVGANSPYRCGQTLKIRNLSTPGSREVIVTVVDQVAGYPAKKINLHRRAFEALGAHPSLGVINVEIIPSPELEQERWGKYLLELAQTAYPGYNVIDYQALGKTRLSQTQTRETYQFILQSPRERIRVRGSVIYNPVTNRVVSFDLVEV
jgi:hypothetical protein